MGVTHLGALLEVLLAELEARAADGGADVVPVAALVEAPGLLHLCVQMVGSISRSYSR